MREPETGNSKAPMAPMDALYEVYRVRCGDRSATPELVEELGRTIAALFQGAEPGGKPHGEAPTLARGELRYGEWRIFPTDPVPSVPGWRAHLWTFEHQDYDGPGDGRCGTVGSIEEAMDAIQERSGG